MARVAVSLTLRQSTCRDGPAGSPSLGAQTVTVVRGFAELANRLQAVHWPRRSCIERYSAYSSRRISSGLLPRIRKLAPQPAVVAMRAAPTTVTMIAGHSTTASKSKMSFVNNAE